jgi:hypothetical protein
MQLGHGGDCCPCPQAGPLSFVVVDTTGVHHVSIDYCDCSERGFRHKWNQLFRVGWIPATSNRPQTVFTIKLLKTYHELTLQGKTTLYDYYHTIMRMTNNLQLEKAVVRLLSDFIGHF